MFKALAMNCRFVGAERPDALGQGVSNKRMLAQRPVIYVTAALLLAACDSRAPLEPTTRRTEPRHTDSELVSLATVMLTTPATSSRADVSSLEQEYITFVPESTWVVVHVNGLITTRENPSCIGLPPFWSCPYGPIGSSFNPDYPWEGGPVSLHAWGETWDVLPLRGTGGATGGSAGFAIGLRYQRAAGTIFGKLGISGSASYNPNGSPSDVGSYLLSNGYEITVHAIPNPMEITAAEVGDSAGTVRYSVGSVQGLAFINPYSVGWWEPAGQIRWSFVVGDSVSVDPNSGGWTWTLSHCDGQTTCEWVPPRQGRMQAQGYVEAQTAKVRGDYVLLEAASDTGGGCPGCGERPLEPKMIESIQALISRVQCQYIRDLLTERLPYIKVFTEQPDEYDNPGPLKLMGTHADGVIYIWEGMWRRDSRGNLVYDQHGNLIVRSLSQFLKDVLVHEGAHAYWSYYRHYVPPPGETTHHAMWRQTMADCGYPGTTG